MFFVSTARFRPACLVFDRGVLHAALIVKGSYFPRLDAWGVRGCCCGDALPVLGAALPLPLLRLPPASCGWLLGPCLGGAELCAGRQPLLTPLRLSLLLGLEVVGALLGPARDAEAASGLSRSAPLSRLPACWGRSFDPFATAR